MGVPRLIEVARTPCAATVAALLALLLVGGQAAAQAPKVASFTVDGAEFVARTDDGRVLRGKELAGAQLEAVFEEKPAVVRIAAVEPDPRDRSGRLLLHTLEVRRPDGSWENPCSADPDGRRQGFPLGNSPAGLDFTCTSGAVGHCVRLGYWPWTKGPGGKPMEPVHAACSRLVRADYGGDDEVNARRELAVDIADALGIRSFGADAGLAFEAGWSPEGAVCVHHLRTKGAMSMAELVQRYPQLKGRTGAVCTQDFARSKGAVLFSRSRP